MKVEPPKDDPLARLTLEPQHGTEIEMAMAPARVHFYVSDHNDLVSVNIKGRGLRLTEDQVIELRDWLDTWVGIYGRII